MLKCNIKKEKEERECSGISVLLLDQIEFYFLTTNMFFFFAILR